MPSLESSLSLLFSRETRTIRPYTRLSCDLQTHLLQWEESLLESDGVRGEILEVMLVEISSKHPSGWTFLRFEERVTLSTHEGSSAVTAYACNGERLSYASLAIWVCGAREPTSSICECLANSRSESPPSACKMPTVGSVLDEDMGRNQRKPPAATDRRTTNAITPTSTREDPGLRLRNPFWCRGRTIFFIAVPRAGFLLLWGKYESGLSLVQFGGGGGETIVEVCSVVSVVQGPGRLGETGRG